MTTGIMVFLVTAAATLYAWICLWRLFKADVLFLRTYGRAAPLSYRLRVLPWLFWLAAGWLAWRGIHSWLS